MILFERRYELDVDMGQCTQSTGTGIQFMQGDTNTSVIAINIKKDSKPLNLTGLEVCISIKEGLYDTETFGCNVIDATNGKILFNVPNKFVDEPGTNYFTVVIQDGVKILKSYKLSYIVVETLDYGVFGTDEELSYLNNLIVSMQNLKDTLAKDVYGNVYKDVDNRFNELTSKQQHDSEVIDSRTDVNNFVHQSLKARLDKIETNPAIIFESVEG